MQQDLFGNEVPLKGKVTEGLTEVAIYEDDDYLEEGEDE